MPQQTYRVRESALLGFGTFLRRSERKAFFSFLKPGPTPSEVGPTMTWKLEYFDAFSFRSREALVMTPVVRRPFSLDGTRRRGTKGRRGRQGTS